ncbi:glycosyltransferase [Massilia glaciei]|uniref:Glycosyltransferase family 1 protein n=1 Tax=Massilia glaciei TaxID=1524097 RepID=A0A2U2HF05_9BURK|nr:glycosyltransferase [Massilia glaciei]PWF42465.1 glycosyltransferase family 1 protein [Massilia glaciei]
MKLHENHVIGRVRSPSVKKIAIVSEHASPLAAPGSIDSGGQNVYVAHLARELALAGYLVDIFTRRDSPRHKPLVQWRENIRVIHVPAGPASYVPKEQMLPHMDAFARFVARFARRQGSLYDLTHANFFMSGMVAQHLKAVLGIPFVITFHALGHVRRIAQGAADTFPPARLDIEDSLMRDADRIIAECEQDRIDMMTLYDAPPGRIRIAPCGFDPQELWPMACAAARAHLGLPQDKFIVLQLGRMVPRKGVDNVIEALALLRAGFGVDAELLVVGGDLGGIPGHPGGIPGAPGAGPTPEAAELARLRALAAELGVGDQVHFTGRRPRAQLRYYYGAADVFITTPWYEPFGITPVEAMACARPVVGAAVGGIKSTVADGHSGLLVPPRDPQAAAACLAMLARDPALARSMGQEGLRRAYQHYTWRSVAGRAAQIYTAAVDDARARALPHMSAH